MLSHCKNAFLLALATFLIGPSSLAARTRLAPSVLPAASIARIEHIIVSGSERAEANGFEALVTRAASNEVQSAKKGMLLYVNDLVSTGNNVELIINSLNQSSESNSKAILYPNTQIRIIDNSSYFLTLGRIWFGVKGAFSVRTFYWILGARGTEFEVQAAKDTSASIAVLNGVVDASTTEVDKTRAPGRGAPVAVKTLEELSLTGPKTRLTRPKPLSEERVRSILDSADEAVLACQPDFPARGVFPHFESPLERSRAFRSARFNSIWRKDPAAFDIVGNVYSDWGEGAKALESYTKELSLNPLLRNSADLLTNIGESYRLLGELDKAEASVTLALKTNQTWAPALNALGNVYFGGAIIARLNKDLEAAKRLLESAAEAYGRAFLAVARNRGVTESITDLAGASTFSSRPSYFLRNNLIDLEFELALADSYLAERTALELNAKRTSNSERSDLLSFVQGILFTGRESVRLVPLDARSLAILDRRNQSRGVAMVGVGDAKTLLGDIAQEQKDPQKAAQLYKEARRAYRQASEFYPDYPYIEIGMNRVTESLEDLPVPPRVETPQPKRSNKLQIPIWSAPAGREAIRTATSLAAVVSYLGESEVEPCEIQTLMLRNLNCCDSGNNYACSVSYGADDSRAWEVLAARVDQRYDVPALVIPLVSYDEIARWIDRSVPMVTLGPSGHAIVISGYSRPDMLVVLDPAVRGERIMPYSGLAEGALTMKFAVPKPLPKEQREVIETASNMVEMFLDRRFSYVMDRTRIRLNALEDRWYTVIRPLGRLVGCNRPRTKRERVDTMMSVKCRFERGLVEFLMPFDFRGRFTDFTLSTVNPKN